MIKPQTDKVGVLEISYTNFQNKYIRAVLFSVMTPISIDYSDSVLNRVSITFESEFISKLSYFENPKTYIAVVNGEGSDCKFVKFQEIKPLG